MFGLVIVYFVRFFALSSNGIKSGYLKINKSMDESAYLLGYSKFKTFTKIHIPYLKNSILLVSILIAIEIIKELDNGYDFVIGSRYMENGKCDYVGYRNFISRFGNKLIKKVLVEKLINAYHLREVYPE